MFGGKGSPKSSWGILWGTSGLFGETLMGLRAALGGPGAPSEAFFGRQAALQNHWFYCIKWYILPPRGGLGGPWGRPVDSQDGQRQGEWSPRRRRQANNNHPSTHIIIYVIVFAQDKPGRPHRKSDRSTQIRMDLKTRGKNNDIHTSSKCIFMFVSGCAWL